MSVCVCVELFSGFSKQNIRAAQGNVEGGRSQNAVLKNHKSGNVMSESNTVG